MIKLKFITCFAFNYLCMLIFLNFAFFSISISSENNVGMNRIIDGKKLLAAPVYKKDGNILLSASSEQKNRIITTFSLDKNYADQIILYSTKLEITDFPINTVEFDVLILDKAPSVVDANTKWYTKSQDGLKSFKGPMAVSFSGRIKSDPGSKAFLTYCGGYLTGYVESGKGEKYDITTQTSPYKLNENKISISELNFSLLDKPGANPFICLTEDKDYGIQDINDYKPAAIDQAQGGKNGLLECRVALEGQFNYYSLMGNDSIIAAKYMISVMAHVSKLYEESINVRLTVPYVIIYTDEKSDPYKNDADFNTKLTHMPYYWPKLPENSALMCMFSSLSGQPDNTNVAGLSYGGKPGVGSLCNANGKTSYSIFGITGNSKYPNYNYTWDVNVVAHEIGHNFGSPHTHSCYYAPLLIDTCVTKSQPVPVGDACRDGAPVPNPGTIMSYCHLSNSMHSVELVFHPRQIAEMRKAAEGAFCIKTIEAPYISLLNPLAGFSCFSGNEIKIRWTSAKISNVAIKYSTDKGNSWNIVADAVPANDTIYTWHAPEVNTKEALIIISDAADPRVADTSDIKFEIIKPLLQCISPGQGKRYGQTEVLNINWESNTGKLFRIEFSSDGGNTWEIIEDSVKGDVITWGIADIISENCLIRITDLDNKELVALSPKFAIGKEFLEIEKPAKDEVICANSIYSLSWKSDFVNSVMLKYSTDGGINWKKHFAPIDASAHYFQWKVPDVYCENAMLMFVMKDYLNIALDSTEYFFKIDTCEATSVNDTDENHRFRILSIIPNPIDRQATINYECTDPGISIIEVYITNLKGEMVCNPMTVNIECGMNGFSFDFGGLAQGAYILYVKMGGVAEGYRVIIGR